MGEKARTACISAYCALLTLPSLIRKKWESIHIIRIYMLETAQRPDRNSFIYVLKTALHYK